MNACKELEHLCCSSKPKVLVLTHAMGGGVARHLAELADVLAERAWFVRLYPGRGKIYVSLPGLDASAQPLRLAFLWPSQQESLWALLARLGVSQVHVHHVLGWPREFWGSFAEHVAVYDLTLHDHLVFCRLTDSVAAQHPWLVEVKRCFAGGSPKTAEVLYQLALGAGRVFVPSRIMAERIRFFFPEIAPTKVSVRPHPEAEKSYDYPQPFLRPLAASEPLRVLCLGMLSTEKGAHVLAGVAQAVAQQQLPFEFHLLGTCHLHLPRSIKRHGSYLDKDIAGWIEQINPHVLWLPAQSPETWSYTLSAGLRAGLPILATRTGAFPERLEGHPLSWQLEVGCPGAEWLSALRDVRQKHGALQQDACVDWQPARAAAFYTAQQDGYLMPGAQCIRYKGEPLADSCLEQAAELGGVEVASWGDKALRLVLGLRRMAIFSLLFRLIPYRWQRRVKRLLSQAPVNEIIKK